MIHPANMATRPAPSDGTDASPGFLSAAHPGSYRYPVAQPWALAAGVSTQHRSIARAKLVSEFGLPVLRSANPIRTRGSKFEVQGLSLTQAGSARTTCASATLPKGKPAFPCLRAGPTPTQPLLRLSAMLYS